MKEFPFLSLRDWISFLEERGDIVHNKVEVDLRGDVSAIAKLGTVKNAPPIIHENIKGYPDWRIASNLFLGKGKMALILGVDRDRFLEEVSSKLDVHVSPIEVSTGPCKEIKLVGEDADVNLLPIPFTGAMEGTPNITAGISNVRDIETGWQNIAVRRFGVKGSKVLSEFINPAQQDSLIWSKYRRRRERMPIAIIIGADPLTYVISQTKVPVGFCEYDLWGAFAGMPLEVVKCETNDLLVPSNAEVIIEGEVDPFEREMDGPFPELYGYYTTIAAVAKVHVTAITMRKNPIYYYMNMGEPPTEGHTMGSLMGSITVYRELSKIFPGILDVYSHRIWGMITIIKVDKRVAKSWSQYAVQIGSIAKFLCYPGWKGIIVVDDDVKDIRNLEEVFDAMVNKFQASKDLTIIPRTTASTLDPSEPWAGRWGWTDLFIMYCTEKPYPWDEGYKRGKAVPPRDALEKAEKNWNSYGFGEK
jgi:4-hydroxy-3-polyprenylbenzoate decarboxylase